MRGRFAVTYGCSITSLLYMFINISLCILKFDVQFQSFALPLMTSSSRLNASTANLTMLPTRSPPSSVFNSFVKVPRSQSTASATYPGFRFGVVPPVGPAVPLSAIVYVLSRSFRTCFANPETMSVVGPL